MDFEQYVTLKELFNDDFMQNTQPRNQYLNFSKMVVLQ